MSSENYKFLKQDIIKYTTIFTVINILFFISDMEQNSIFSSFYLKLIVLFNLGLMTYWLVIKKFL